MTADVAPIAPATISLPATITTPKGGGALRGLGETIGAVTATGTSTSTVPLALPAGRGGAPALALLYSSGAGTSEFGLGWSVPLPSIDRRTDRGLPQYLATDRFVLDSTEDLIEVGHDAKAQPLGGTGPMVSTRWFRPRTEAGFARIGCHLDPATGVVFWTRLDGDDQLTVYGRTAAARIADPADPTRVFRWLVEDVYDDRGGHVHYHHRADDEAGVDPSAPHEVHRRGPAPAARLLKEVLYANRTPVADRFAAAPSEDQPGWRADFCFRIVFDYGDHSGAVPKPDPDRPWSHRADACSTHRAGFEVRTRRRCERIIVVHQFPADLGEPATVVATTTLHYELGATAPDRVAAKLLRISHAGIRSDGGADEQAPLDLHYRDPQLPAAPQLLDARSADGLPAGITGSATWVDLEGDGVPGILATHAGATTYKENHGAGLLAPPRQVDAWPAGATGADGQTTLAVSTLLGDQRLTVVEHDGHTARIAVRSDDDHRWAPFRAFNQQPNLDWSDPAIAHVDLDGDGLPDVVRLLGDAVEWHRFAGESGWDPIRRVGVDPDERAGPAVVLSDGTRSISFADMTGDGLADLVRVRERSVCYWPNLGHGRFGPMVTMSTPPDLGPDGSFHPDRVRLVDLDGSGPADLVLLSAGGMTVWANEAGNSWAAPKVVPIGWPGPVASVAFVDLLGRGTPCAVISTPLPGRIGVAVQYVDLMPGGKPHLLTRVEDNLGTTTDIAYGTSSAHALAARGRGQPWRTHVPFPVQVVDAVTTTDAVLGVSSTRRYRYHDGYYDVTDREFRGFGRVEATRADALASPGPEGPQPLPPTVEVTWYHTGSPRAALDRAQPADPPIAGTDARQDHELHRALRGRPLRTALYALDGTAASRFPYSVVDSTWEPRLLESPPADPDGWCITMAVPVETITRHLERQPVGADLVFPDPELVASLPPVPADQPVEPPRIEHTLAAVVNDLGQVEAVVSMAYGNPAPGALPPQRASIATVTTTSYANELAAPGWRRLGVVVASASFDVVGLAGSPPAAPLTRPDLQALAAAPVVASGAPDPPAGPPARRSTTARRLRYWDDAVEHELPAGAIGRRAQLRRSLDAALGAQHLHELGPEVTGPALSALGYEQASDDHGEVLWWRPSDVSQPDPAAFHAVTASVDAFGTATFATLDADQLLPRAVLVTSAVGQPGTQRVGPDPAGPTWNVVRAVVDHRVLQPREVVDPHGCRTTTTFDGLGAVVGIRHEGANGEGPPAGGLSTEYRIDRRAWLDRRTPASVRTRSRVRDDQDVWVESVDHSSASGVIAQVKQQVEAGPAPYRLADGSLARDAAAGTLLTRAMPMRWLGTGRIVFDGKARPVRRYDPFIAVDDSFDAPSDLGSMGHATTVSYDAADRAVRVDFPDGAFATVTPGIWSTTAATPDDLTSRSAWYAERTAPGVDPALQAEAAASLAHEGTPSSSILDGRGRPISLVERSGGAELSTTMVHDSAGRLLSISDPRGITVQATTYDLLGRAIRTTSPDSGTMRALSDVVGRPALEWLGASATDPLDHDVRVRHEHDRLGRPTRTWVTDHRAGAVAGERCRSIVQYGDERPGAASAYLLGIAARVLDGAGAVEVVRNDFRGHPVEGRRAFADDFAGEPDWTGAALAADPWVAAATDLEPEWHRTTAATDALGRIVHRVEADGSELTLAHTPDGLVSRIVVDPTGAAAPVVALDSVVYSPARQPEVTRIGPAGAVAVITHERDGRSQRLRRVSVTRPGAGRPEPVQDLRYQYDIVGNVLAVTDRAQPTNFFANAVVPPDRTYRYDDRWQLVEATGRELAGLNHTTASSDRRPPVRSLPDVNDLQAVANFIERYTYDVSGNLTALRHEQQSTPARSWTRTNQPVGDSNRLTSSTVTGAIGSADAMAYDRRGNVTTLGPRELATGWGGKVVRAIVNGNVVAHYQYDSAGHRTRKVVVKNGGGRIEDRRYIGGIELDEVRDGHGAVLDAHRSLRVDTGTEVVAVFERATVRAGTAVTTSAIARYRLVDLVGTTTVELDDAGNPISYEEVHPYGTTAYESSRPGAGVSIKRYRFTGQERDDETGLERHGDRYYAPWLGRWTAPDPSGLIDGTNVWTYTRNRPTSATDPTGHVGPGLSPGPGGPLPNPGLPPGMTPDYGSPLQGPPTSTPTPTPPAPLRPSPGPGGRLLPVLGRSLIRGAAGSVAAVGIVLASVFWTTNASTDYSIDYVPKGGGPHVRMRNEDQLSNFQGWLHRIQYRLPPPDDRTGPALFPGVPGKAPMQDPVPPGTIHLPPRDGPLDRIEDPHPEGRPTSIEARPLTPAERAGLQEQMKRGEQLTKEQRNRLRSEARYLWEQANGQPAPKGFEVHHIIPLEFAHLFPERDPNDLSNLGLMERQDHNDLHNLLNWGFRAFKDQIDRALLETMEKNVREGWKDKITILKSKP